MDLTPDALAQKRIQACQAEISAICKKYNCVLDAKTTISQSGISSQIIILALKDPPEQKIPMPPISPEPKN